MCPYCTESIRKWAAPESVQYKILDVTQYNFYYAQGVKLYITGTESKEQMDNPHRDALSGVLIVIRI